MYLNAKSAIWAAKERLDGVIQNSVNVLTVAISIVGNDVLINFSP
jgi:hypothetical protein